MDELLKLIPINGSEVRTVQNASWTSTYRMDNAKSTESRERAYEILSHFFNKNEKVKLKNLFDIDIDKEALSYFSSHPSKDVNELIPLKGWTEKKEMTLKIDRRDYMIDELLKVIPLERNQKETIEKSRNYFGKTSRNEIRDGYQILSQFCTEAEKEILNNVFDVDEVTLTYFRSYHSNSVNGYFPLKGWTEKKGEALKMERRWDVIDEFLELIPFDKPERDIVEKARSSSASKEKRKAAFKILEKFCKEAEKNMLKTKLDI